MRAIALDVTAARATVLLRPCWLARWLGAPETIVELERGEAWQWIAVATKRRLGWIPHGALIENALDLRPRERLPEATARR